MINVLSTYKFKKHHTDLLNTLVEEFEACVSVTDEGALLDKLREHLSLGEVGIKLLLGPVSRL